MRVQILCLLATLASAGNAAAAEAVTYSGTLGKLPIIVELVAPGADGNFVGRYAYLSKGVDIPLHGMKAGKGMALEEEKPCTDKLCKKGDYDVVETAPIGAEWSLKPAKDGTLTGTWKDKTSGKSLPVKLERKAARTVDDNSTGFDMLDPTFVLVPALTPKDLPYDFLKMTTPLKQGEEKSIGNSAYRLDEDPRTKMAYPVVTKLGDADPAPLNTSLAAARLQWELPAFSCLSKAYHGFTWQPGIEASDGYDGGGSVSVDYLSPRLMGVLESGSYFCGGAHPDNFANHHLIDAKTGKLLSTGDFLGGWIATDADGKVVDPSTVEDQSTLTFGPSDELVKYIGDHRVKNDPQVDPECPIDDLIRTNLGVYFTQTDMVLTLADLPNVVFACTTDLVKIPLKDAKPLLKDSATKYFEVLDN